jgi:hypothetical protein
MTEMTIDQYKSLNSINSKRSSKFSKYKAVPTIVDGIRFHSKKEADYYKELKFKQELGEISYFLMQVPFRLPGNIKYLCDFMVVHTNERPAYDLIDYIDVKGYDTKISKLKRKQVEEIYGIEIKLI